MPPKEGSKDEDKTIVIDVRNGDDPQKAKNDPQKPKKQQKARKKKPSAGDAPPPPPPLKRTASSPKTNGKKNGKKKPPPITMDVAAKDEARAVRTCQRIVAARPEDYRALASRFEFVSRLGSEFGNSNPQDMKKVKKQHGGFEAFVVAHATELFAFTPPPSPGGAPRSPEDFSDFILNDVCVGEHVLELLRAQDIGSIETLRMLNLDDLRAIPGLALGPRRKLHEAITELRDGGVT